jgi:hypothetical protein|tara:strand:+ start:783 stop:899 length:117 start_codon:yes stop_codon:yes gene_type:complete
MELSEVLASYPVLKPGSGRSSIVFTKQDYLDAIDEDLI